MRRSVPVLALIVALLVPLTASSQTRTDTVSEPLDLSAVPGNSMVILDWTKPAIGSSTVLGYRLYRGDTDSSLTFRADIPGQGTSAIDLVENGALYYYSVSAYNALGEGKPSDIVSCQGDGIDPEVLIVAPEDGSFLPGGEVMVSWSGSDEGSGISKYEVWIDYGNPVDVGTATEYAFADLEEGAHTVTVRAFDVARNMGSDSISFVLDQTPPEVDLLHPFEDEWLNGTDISVRWESSDELSGIGTTKVTVDDSRTYTIDGSETMVHLLEGRHIIAISVADKAMNEAVRSANITVDATAPSVTIDGPWCVPDDEVGIEIDVDEDLDPYPLQEFLLNGVNVEASGGPRTWTVQGLAPGSNDVTVRVMDRAGNTGVDDIDVLYDNVAPQITSNLEDRIVLNSRSFTLTYAVDDLGCGVRSVQVSLDGSSPVEVGSSGSRMFNFGSEGEHQLDLIALDKVGNEASSSCSFLIDSIVPTIVDFQPQGTVEDRDAVISVEFSEPMDRESTTIYSPTLTGSVEWTGEKAIFFPDTLPMADTIWVHVEGSDLAGNRLADFSFKFETTSDGTVTGRVVDEDGDPIQDALVTLDNGRYVRTLPDGSFTISDTGGDDRYLIVSKNGYEDFRMDLPIVAGRVYEAGVIQLETGQGDGPSVMDVLQRALGLSIILLVPLGLMGYLLWQIRRNRDRD